LTGEFTAKERFEHLLKVVSSDRFLTKQGLGNEVPFFICPYSAVQAFDLDGDRQRLVKQLANAGVTALDLNLYDLALDLLRERGILEKILEIEADETKGEIKEMLQSVLDPQTHLIPKISTAIKTTPHDVIFISGVGEVYPYIRSHNVLNNLQSTAKDKPTIMFFPGNYSHALASGASLDLFGQLHDDKYYRAFNILNYEV
jgi:BREX protein BrxB